jgi:RNA polymerase subunit RPABC4/transcription elongation factor Spt4
MKRRVCPRCGCLVPGDEDTCHYCGYPIDEAVYDSDMEMG